MIQHLLLVEDRRIMVMVVVVIFGHVWGLF